MSIDRYKLGLIKKNMNSMKLILIFCLIIIAQITNGQQVLNGGNVDKIVDEIAKDQIFMSENKAWAGGMTDQWKRFERLKKIAKDDELINLTNHENPAVKCYSFMALSNKKHPKTFQVLKEHLLDNQEIRRMRGCVGDKTSIGQFFLEVAYPNVRELKGHKFIENQKKAILNSKMFVQNRKYDANRILLGEIVDSILVFDEKLNSKCLERLMSRIKPKKYFYNRVKEIYLNKGELSCLTAIAKFKKKEDINLLIEAITESNVHIKRAAIFAVIHFPHKDFFHYLKQIHKKETTPPNGIHSYQARALYLALVQYKNSESKKILEATINNQDAEIVKVHAKHIEYALKEYPNDIYKSVQLQLKNINN